MAAARAVCFLALAAAYAVWPNARPDLTQFNADDSESYLALSYALTHGLGYTRNLVVGQYVPHTTWPPGFPLLLAPLTAVGGLPIDWLAVKAWMIAIGLTGIALAWVYVRRVTASAATADAAALLLALLPFYWLFSRTAMTEGPSITFAFLALLLTDCAWARQRPRASRVALAGLASGLGMLLRGTNVCLLLVPLAYAVGPRRAIAAPWRRLALLALHAAAFCVPALVWAARNRSIDKQGLGLDGIDQLRMLLVALPTDPTSPMVTAGEVLRNAIANIAYRIIYHVPEQLIPGLWNAGWWNWPGAPFIAVALTLAVMLAALPRSSAGLPLMLVVAPYVALLNIYAWGGSIRFWVPVTGLLMVLIVINAGSFAARLSGRARLLATVAVGAACAASLLVFAQRFEARPYLGDLGDMVTLFDRIGRAPAPAEAVHTDHAILFTLRTGLAAPMTLAARGIEPRYTHLILHGQEIPEAPVRRPPPGAALLSSEGEWRYYALPAPMTERELSARQQ